MINSLHYRLLCNIDCRHVCINIRVVTGVISFLSRKSSFMGYIYYTEPKNFYSAKTKQKNNNC